MEKPKNTVFQTLIKRGLIVIGEKTERKQRKTRFYRLKTKVP